LYPANPSAAETYAIAHVNNEARSSSDMIDKVLRIGCSNASGITCSFGGPAGALFAAMACIPKKSFGC